MSDFHQGTSITTLHSLHTVMNDDDYQQALSARLEEHSQHCHISLLLPCLYTELENKQVMDRILNAIDTARYLRSVVIALGGAQLEQYLTARMHFTSLAKEDCSVHVIWVDGKEIQEILTHVQDMNINAGLPGKGQSVWIALGYILGGLKADVIALHDCDVATYSSTLLARLVEPVADPSKNYEFCKGFYSRVSPGECVMRGRVTRLFVSPFLSAMIPLMRQRGLYELENYFQFHQSFRYALAGEFCMSRNMAKAIDISYDWGLEVGTLSQVYENLHPRKIAQVDLEINYEHKHQPLSENAGHGGLHRMVVDIARNYLNVMRSKGYALSDDHVDVLQNAYLREALDSVRRYADDSSINHLSYDRYHEEQMVLTFRQYLWTAWQQVKGSLVATQLPSWSRISYSVPEIYSQLLEAVSLDMSL
ncbi:MAG: glycosyl transferase [Cyanobacteriota bacterium]|nr:glycosyl transferase [Cyanobacteriota bacterium]